MAQSFIQGNTDGTGKKVDTRVTNTAAQHRMVIAVGDPNVDANVAPVDPVNGMSVQLIPALPTGANNIGTVGLKPQTSGGTTATKYISAANTNANNIKGSPGQVFDVEIDNVSASVRYVKLYNKASAPTVGTDIPVITLAVQPNNNRRLQVENGIAFGLGISIAMTGGQADADTTAIAAGDLVVNVMWV